MTRKTTDLRCEEGSDRTDFVGMLRGAGLLLAGCAAAVLLFSVAGCSATDTDEPSIASTAEVLEENASEKSVEYASFEEVAAAFDASALNLEYSKRDMDASFDESSATKITLSGDSASVSGSGAVTEGSTVTISAAGTYIVSGNLTDGSITVTTSEDDKVQIILNGVKIASSSGPAIDIQSADKCFITLAEGTQNSLSDGSAFTSEDANACIYATCDLTINGSGSLDVSGNYRHGVFSKDDLVVYGGTIRVSAVEDGLNGKDSVKIGAGDISIDSGADGVKSSKSTNLEKGFVYVSGGSLSIDAEDDGIQAKTYLCIAGGSIEIDATDDALHSDLEGALNGGSTSVRSGGDAFHCETKLEVNDGSFVAETCNEGYEAEWVVVNGGDTNIFALDDAMNASAADLSDDSESSDADTSTSAPSGEPGANAAQPMVRSVRPMGRAPMPIRMSSRIRRRRTQDGETVRPRPSFRATMALRVARRVRLRTTLIKPPMSKVAWSAVAKLLAGRVAHLVQAIRIVSSKSMAARLCLIPRVMVLIPTAMLKSTAERFW